MICLMNTIASGFYWYIIYAIIKKVAFNIYAIFKTVYCFNLSQEDLLEADTKRCFLMQVKSENIETVHRKASADRP